MTANLAADAESSLRRSAELAVTGRDDRLFIRAASRLSFALGALPEQGARAMDWLALARRTFERIGSPEVLSAWLDLQELAVLVGAGRWDECATTTARAQAGERRLGDRLHEAEAAGALAFCRSYRRPLDEVMTAAQAALQLSLLAYGPEHPETANAMGTLSWFRWLAGDHAAALALASESLRVIRALGQPTPQLANALDQQAKILFELGREREALQLRLEARTILERVRHQPTSEAELLAGLASSEEKAGLEADAFRDARRASALCTPERVTAAADSCAFAQFVDARVLARRGQRAEATRQAGLARDGFATLPVTRRLREQVEQWARNAGLALPPAAQRRGS
jgi:hypothetical protein